MTAVAWHPTMHCRDCGESVEREWYTVRDHVWAAARMERLGGCLCVGCLEARLGRELTAADFADVPVNRTGPGTAHSPRLLSRLTRGRPE